MRTSRDPNGERGKNVWMGQTGLRVWEIFIDTKFFVEQCEVAKSFGIPDRRFDSGVFFFGTADNCLIWRELEISARTESIVGHRPARSRSA